MDEKELLGIERLSKLLKSRIPDQVALETMLFLFVELLAFTGNLLVCYVFYKRPRLRTVTNVYVGALAISDVLMSALAMPWTVGILIKGEWIFSRFACQFQGFMVLLLAWSSLHIMTLTAINRYFCVVRSTLYKKWFSVKSSIVMVTVVIATIIVYILTPIITGWSQFIFRPGKATCFMTFYHKIETIRKAYVAVAVFVYTVFPMVTIFVCYYKVFKIVRNNVITIKHSMRDRSNRDRTTALHVREVRVTRTLFCMVIAFVFCWIPVTVVEMMNSILGAASLPRQAYVCYTLFAYISGAVNPIIYAVINKVFRRHLISLLPWTINRNISSFTAGLSQSAYQLNTINKVSSVRRRNQQKLDSQL